MQAQQDPMHLQHEEKMTAAGESSALFLLYSRAHLCPFGRAVTPPLNCALGANAALISFRQRAANANFGPAVLVPRPLARLDKSRFFLVQGTLISLN